MKILFIILGLDFSGAEIVLIDYLKNNKAIEPFFAFIYKGEAKREFIKEFGATKCYDCNIEYNKNELRFIPKIVQKKLAKKIQPFIKEINPEILYFNNSLEIALSRLILKINKIYSVGHIHGMKNSLGTYFKVYEAQHAINELDLVIAVSEACKKSWKNDKIKVVYNGIDKIHFRNKEKTINKEYTIGFVGMISKIKGFDILLKVIYDLDIKCHWKIAYQQIDPQFSESILKLQKCKNVEIYHKIPRDKIKNFYDSLDILVIPSRQDALPTVAIEAMARKVLVLGSNVGGIPELVGSEKFLFKAKSENALKEILMHYLCIDRIKFRGLLQEQQEKIQKFNNENKQLMINDLLINKKYRKE